MKIRIPGREVNKTEVVNFIWKTFIMYPYLSILVMLSMYILQMYITSIIKSETDEDIVLEEN